MDLIRSITHPDELLALLKFKYGGGRETVMPLNQVETLSSDMQLCFELLNRTSRSFAAVIQALHEELRFPVCIFYLVLRALDTVEDDMTIPTEEKVSMLKSFYTHLEEPGWCYMGCKDKDKIVLENFSTVSAEYRKLDEVYRIVISDICRRMGEGMTVFLETHPDSLEDWDKYCHYVAGLVGIGLSRLFAASQLEDECVGQDEHLANSLGLFLQKTNIIRDYLEDINEDRQFWPKAVWSLYTKQLADFKMKENAGSAVLCLNHLVTNAMQHAPDVLAYMCRIRNQSVFNFCAIPQVMAIGTLARCYNNHDVFTRVVKIRRGEAVRMMMEATSMESLKQIMHQSTCEIGSKIPFAEPNAIQTLQIVQKVMKMCSSEASTIERSPESQSVLISVLGRLKYVAAVAVLAFTWQYWSI